jgi:hypothetical protein
MLKRKINKKFLLASVKAALEFLFRLPFSLIGRFSQVYVHAKGGFRNSFENHRVTGSFFELVSDLKEANYSNYLSPQRRSQKIRSHQ